MGNNKRTSKKCVDARKNTFEQLIGFICSLPKSNVTAYVCCKGCSPEEIKSLASKISSRLSCKVGINDKELKVYLHGVKA